MTTETGSDESPERLRRRIATALATRTRHLVADSQADARAAVTLILRPDLTGSASLLFIQRSEHEDDPWSGHMALPGGHRSRDDASLLATAIRETREETSLQLREEEILGPLDDVHPLSRQLPSIAITPFVAWHLGTHRVRGNREIRDHVWVTLDTLLSAARRSTLSLTRENRTVIFPTIEYRGYTIWGLTFEIVSSFLGLLGPAVREGASA